MIELSHEQHMEGCAAFSGAETALLQARITLGALEIEMQRAAREARLRGCDTRDINQAIETMRKLSQDLLARRGLLLEMHRVFRALDEDLTPIRPSSDSALAAFRASANFPKKD